MSEKSMSQRVMECLRVQGLDPVRVENSCGPGTPDIQYIDGWLELKELDAWPKKAETVVACPHFTPQQRIWLRRRCDAGGQAWLLLKVKQDWLLLWGLKAATILGKVCRAELETADQLRGGGLKRLVELIDERSSEDR